MRWVRDCVARPACFARNQGGWILGMVSVWLGEDRVKRTEVGERKGHFNRSDESVLKPPNQSQHRDLDKWEWIEWNPSHLSKKIENSTRCMQFVHACSRVPYRSAKPVQWGTWSFPPRCLLDRNPFKTIETGHPPHLKQGRGKVQKFCWSILAI